jgi:hypothetical protein
MESLGTSAGIVASTLILVEVFKRLFVSVESVKEIPTWMVAVVISASLTLIAFLLKAFDGSVLDFGIETVKNAAIAGGFYSWLREPLDPIKKSTPLGSVVLCSAVLLVSGCQTVNDNLSPTQQYQQISDSYSTVLNEITLQSRLGFHSLETLERVNVLRLRVREVIDSMETAVIEGREVDFNFWLREARNLLNQMIVIQQLGETRHGSNGSSGNLERSAVSGGANHGLDSGGTGKGAGLDASRIGNGSAIPDAR